MYVLAADATPDAVVEEAIARAQRGEVITHAKAKALVCGEPLPTNGEASAALYVLAAPTTPESVGRSISGRTSLKGVWQGGPACDR